MNKKLAPGEVRKNRPEAPENGPGRVSNRAYLYRSLRSSRLLEDWKHWQA